MSVGVEDFGLADKAEVLLLLVHHGQVPCTCVLEDLHDLTHRHGVGENGLGRVHELLDGEAIIQARLEHNVAYLV